MIKNFFWHLFSDRSPLNATGVVGFMSFLVMAIFAFADIFTGIIGKDLVINDIIYQAFVAIVGGAFLGAGFNADLGNKNLKDEKEEA
jgi:hypothetical protein